MNSELKLETRGRRRTNALTDTSLRWTALQEREPWVASVSEPRCRWYAEYSSLRQIHNTPEVGMQSTNEENTMLIIF
ncbi:hypothetical protein E2C01_053624 [Portunus trituberculatus]|uniref:Uncharacterized protein n=1 Tax=Portunus trituberculatus TaxID=210409 RepID=A0A5B7GH91_PORTR|nr:hypothetical protein [Portunus trituberculatus]